jgi:hypothetical protein
VPGDRSTQRKNLICSGHDSIYYHYHIVRNPPLRPAFPRLEHQLCLVAKGLCLRKHGSDDGGPIPIEGLRTPAKRRHRAGSSSFLLQSQLEGLKIFASSFGCCLSAIRPAPSFFMLHGRSLLLPSFRSSHPPQLAPAGGA